MNLRRKIVIFISLTTVICLLITFFFLNNILLKRFALLDEEDIRSDMQQIIYSIQDELQSITTNMVNYSAWDDTSQFVQQAMPLSNTDHDPYIQSNYPDATYMINRLHMIALYNSQHQLIHGRSFNYDDEQQTTIPPHTLEALMSNSYRLFQFNSPKDSHSGILMMDEGPMMIVSLPIVTSDLKYPIVGTMIVGRMLDDYQIERINKQTSSNIQFDAYTNLDSLKNNKQPIWFEACSSDNLLKVNSIVNNIFGEPILIVSTEKEREVYLQGRQAVFNYAFVIFICSILICLIVMFFIKRYITDRIVSLINNIRAINQKRDFSLRINGSGTDEFSELEKEFDFMMNSLESAMNTLQVQVLHDPLTSLPNRTYFYQKLESALISTLSNKDDLLAILYIDLNNFKWVNDTWGHDNGDALLTEVAARLRQFTKPTDMVFRIGGDEFTVLLTNLKKKTDANNLAKELLNYISSTPFELKGREFSISASIGVSMYPLDGDSPDKLVKHADIAMFHAKQSGIHLALYSEELQDEINRQTLIENHINYAVATHSLILNYQPIVDITSQRTVGIEALVRWHHPVLGWLSPSEFIPIAESSGVIIEIGLWVLQQACEDIRYIQQHSFPDLYIAVNLSVIQLEREHIVKEILAVLLDTGIQPSQLHLEITESATMSHGKAAHNLQQLEEHGIRISVDDFGTGYSSLSYLRKFPVHTIKIDRSFISEMSATNVDSTISKSIIDLGHSLNLKVVAEGVETDEQWTLLQHLGCDYIQGYLISKPLIFEDLLQFLNNQNK
jgi:diguanylate cyclase (GGDEF)-like protein